MKERNENLHTNHFHNPFSSFASDDDVKFRMRRENGRILEFVLALTF